MAEMQKGDIFLFKCHPFMSYHAGECDELVGADTCLFFSRTEIDLSLWHCPDYVVWDQLLAFACLLKVMLNLKFPFMICYERAAFE